MVWSGFEPGTAGWWVQANPLSYSGHHLENALVYLHFVGSSQGTAKQKNWQTFLQIFSQILNKPTHSGQRLYFFAKLAKLGQFWSRSSLVSKGI